MPTAQTLFDKLWAQHVVASDKDGDLIAIDRIMLHERTGGVALKSLNEAGYTVQSPARVFAIMDHVVSFKTDRGRDDSRAPGGDVFITQTRAMANGAGIRLIDTDDARQGIVHVVAPELGIALPGLSIVCPDSHTCSLGALGALAWGIGSSEAEHAMVTGTLRMKRPPQMRIRVSGALQSGVTAKDLVLHLIARYGAAGGQRSAIEFSGEVVEAMDIEARLTLCNLAVEFSAFTAIIAPDETLLAGLRGKPFAPGENDWAAATDKWSELKTDVDARFDHEIELDASNVRPTVSWGTSPEHSGPIDQPIPADGDPRALAYMGLAPGDRLTELYIQGAFIGSCTNGRLSDLRAAAAILRGSKVAPGVRAVCVPGSQAVRRAAEAEGIDEVFKAAGFEWGAPGCAMCFYAGGETFAPGARVISSTNRNFEGRQGPGVRTHLASPATVAASAIAGRIACAGQGNT
ncbi:3-isopropylmalate dehydratase large subunit [Hyphomonas sp.]|uniref:3-isopropylmalate dehydratase large subunit n=1 Tax=Hyphomonas sp. TaxID=87 RepID=UPI001DF04099|nr:3-isopropylmalate dehydratase large subunit [Hyphomonas sp.]